jgi:hypothetical protein
MGEGLLGLSALCASQGSTLTRGTCHTPWDLYDGPTSIWLLLPRLSRHRATGTALVLTFMKSLELGLAKALAVPQF